MDKLIEKHNWVEIKKINKGMSGDTKYKVKDKFGKSFLLRVSEIDSYQMKKHEYELILKWNQSNIPMPKAVDFGICNEGKSVYTLLQWIEGIEVQEVLPAMNRLEQYELGKKSGSILKKIHASPASNVSGEWSERYFAVMNERFEAFRREGVHFVGDDIILDYLDKKAYLLQNRPLCYLHGDYHMGNMIYSPEGELNVIDWHTVDFENFGDPWYEFNRIGVEFTAFASGQIDGYFDDEVPEIFWELFAFYLSASAITSVVWAKYWAPEEYDHIIKLNQNILKWFDNMKTLKPNWYMKPSESY